MIKFTLFILAFLSARSSLAVELVFEEDHRLPVVYLNVAVQTGAVEDPKGAAGLNTFTAQLLMRGTQKHTKAEVDQELDQMGAELEVDARKEIVVFRAAVLTQQLDRFLNLLAEILTEPRFDAKEAKKVRSEMTSGLLETLSSDRTLANNQFERLFFGSHPYGNPVDGKIRDVKALNESMARSHFQKYYVKQRMLVLGTGDADRSKLQTWANKVAEGWPEGAKREPIPEMKAPTETRIFLIDKPDRTQTQIYGGTLGMTFTDPDYYSWNLGNEVFGGGTFTARLMKEIRFKRGWTYSTYSTFKFATQPHTWRYWVFPADKDAPSTVALIQQMIEEIKTTGITEEEFKFTQQRLINSAGFRFDTPLKRIENSLIEHSLGLPEGFSKDFGFENASLSRTQVNDALGKRMHPEAMTLVVLGTAKTLLAPLAKALGVSPRSIKVVPYREE